MRGLRKISKPIRGKRRFPGTENRGELEATRQRPCMLKGKRITITVWRRLGDDVFKSPVPQEMQHVCSRHMHAHHVETKARGGADTPENLWSLCSDAHAELHQIGQAAFVKRWGLVPSNHGEVDK